MTDNSYDKPKAGCLAIFFSFIFPVVGFIIYFLQRDKVDNPNAYLFAAFAGIIVNTLGALSL